MIAQKAGVWRGEDTSSGGILVIVSVCKKIATQTVDMTDGVQMTFSILVKPIKRYAEFKFCGLFRSEIGALQLNKWVKFFSPDVT
ncbi:hypothetical protein POVCU2_0036440 [Plasmodium ovale curtisi]|uniref:Uncharacterized protein n=1 Tax=Plasmodium ovale curtisi TaxID=864141 RepID=A0A1A8X748_PLAOA|nr:hypothetical protein POVCU2_0036440 [Plasmodium ovale curtisi]SBT01067.1 hypothetical protein POVCU1_064370 [Plasmodium ovale curtisi]